MSADVGHPRVALPTTAPSATFATSSSDWHRFSLSVAFDRRRDLVWTISRW
jgi:hypothetical protein